MKPSRGTVKRCDVEAHSNRGISWDIIHSDVTTVVEASISVWSSAASLSQDQKVLICHCGLTAFVSVWLLPLRDFELWLRCQRRVCQAITYRLFLSQIYPSLPLSPSLSLSLSLTLTPLSPSQIYPLSSLPSMLCQPRITNITVLLFNSTLSVAAHNDLTDPLDRFLPQFWPCCNAGLAQHLRYYFGWTALSRSKFRTTSGQHRKILKQIFSILISEFWQFDKLHRTWHNHIR